MQRFLLIAILMLPALAYGQITTSWTGSGNDGDWSNAANWDNGVPGAADEAIIDVNATLNSATAGTPTISRLLVKGGANRMININIDLNVTGQQINDRAVQLNAAMLTIGFGAELTVQAAAGFEGVFLNNANALFTVDGELTVTSNADDGIRINSGGTLSNNGLVIVDGGATNDRLLMINDGTLNNFNLFGLSGGRQFSRGQVEATGLFINHRNAVLDTEDGRIKINGAGTFTNEGLFTATIGTPLRTDAAAPNVTNNGFYEYGNGVRLFADDGTNATGTDQGIDLNDATRTTIDAGGSCSADIAQAAYAWFDGTTEVGTSDATGLLNFNPGSLTSDPATLTTTIPGVSVSITNPCTMALPITLLDFTAAAKEHYVELFWQTIAETSNAYVAVERSPNGRDFEEFDRHLGRQDSRELRSYYSVDRKPETGMNYYRLRQVDLDGTTTFSKVIALRMGEAHTALTLYPTVVQRGQVIRVSANNDRQSNFIVSDLQGREVLRINADKQTEIFLNTQLLNVGGYLLRSTSSGAGTPASRFFVQ